VFVLHEETMNQYPGMAFYGGVFSKGGGVEYAGNGAWGCGTISSHSNTKFGRQWRIMGFIHYSISQVVLFCIRQCYGY
jgi:hypothetical protein